MKRFFLIIQVDVQDAEGTLVQGLVEAEDAGRALDKYAAQFWSEEAANCDVPADRHFFTFLDDANVFIAQEVTKGLLTEVLQ